MLNGRNFEAQHDELRAEYGRELREHEYGKTDFLEQIEEVYVNQRAAVLELAEALAKPALMPQAGPAETIRDQPPA